MFRIYYEETINAPRDLVWDVITDTAQYPQWNPFITDCETTFEVGSPIVMKVRLLPGRTITQTETVRENIPGELIEYGVDASGLLLRSSRKHVLTELSPEQTRYESVFILEGLVQPLVRLTLGKHLRRGFREMSSGIAMRSEELFAK